MSLINIYKFSVYKAESGVRQMKIRKSMIPLLVGLLIGLPLKIYQLIKVVDYSTGFYKKGDFSSIVLPLVIVISIGAIFVLAFTSKQFPKYSPNEKSVPMGLITAALGVVAGYQSAVQLLDAEKAAFEGTIGMVYSCLGLISVLSFLFLAVGFFSGVSLAESKPAIMMLPVLWMGLRMVMTFLNMTTKANINENIYDLVTMVLMLIFLLSSAKFMSGAGDNTAKLTFASGASAALMAAITTIPRYVFKIISKSENAEMATEMGVRADKAFDPNLVDLMLMIFAVGLLFYISIPLKQVVRRPSAVPVQRMPMQPGMPAAAAVGGYNAMQRGYPQQRPYPQGMPQGGMRSPYMPQQRRNMPPQPLPGAGADIYTTRGAGIKITDEFAIRTPGAVPAAGDARYGGLNSFREGMLSGQRALEVLESSYISTNEAASDDEYGKMLMQQGLMFSASDIAQLQENSADAEMSEMTEEVTESLSSLFAQRDNMTKPPKEAVISDGSDEAAEDYQERREEDYPPPPPPSRSVRLGSGRYDGKLSDRLNEMDDRRARRGRAPTPIDEMPYDNRYGMYEDDYYETEGGYDERGNYGYERDRYDRYDRRDGYGEYDDYEDEYAEEYEDDYYDDREYGSTDYYEYDEDYEEEYEDDYDEYDEYDDEYDEYDERDYGYNDYDDEGYGSW